MSPSASRWNLEPRPRAEVLAELERRLRPDQTYGSGRIVGTMISAPHPIAAEVFQRYLEKNLGDPGLYPASLQLEREAVGWLADLLSKPDAVGSIVSGGSEANILALWAARDRDGTHGRQVILSATAHVSYDKAARLLGLELVRVPLDRRGCMDVEVARRAVRPDTLAIVASAGSTDLGTVDAIADLAAIARANAVPLHVDAAFGGFVLPFLDGAPPFDFRLEGVTSITIDPHKMGLSVQPSGAILFRDEAVARPIRVEVSYLAGGPTVHGTLTGTRSGAASLAVWATLRHLGREGYREIVRKCMEETRWMRDRVREAGLDVVVEPVTNLLAIRAGALSAPELAAGLRERGWGVSCFPTHVRVVVLPHLTRAHLEAFVRDLGEVAGVGAKRRRGPGAQT